MMRVALCLAAGLACTILGGCSLVRSWFTPTTLPEIHNPITELDEIAIVPVAASDAGASATWTEHLRGELLRVQGVDRVRLVNADSSMTNPRSLPTLPDSARGLLQIDVLRFDPYYPPVAHLEINFYAPPSFAGSSGRDVLTLDRQGNDSIAVGSRRREPWLRFETVFRADDPTVVRAIEKYASAQHDEDRGLSAVDRITRISDRFKAFVIYETLKECFARLDSAEHPTPPEPLAERKLVHR